MQALRAKIAGALFIHCLPNTLHELYRFRGGHCNECIQRGRRRRQGQFSECNSSNQAQSKTLQFWELSSQLANLLDLRLTQQDSSKDDAWRDYAPTMVEGTAASPERTNARKQTTTRELIGSVETLLTKVREQNEELATYRALSARSDQNSDSNHVEATCANELQQHISFMPPTRKFTLLDDDSDAESQQTEESQESAHLPRQRRRVRRARAPLKSEEQVMKVVTFDLP